MHRANHLHDLALSLERLRDQVENALALTGQQTASLEDELSRHARRKAATGPGPR